MRQNIKNYTSEVSVAQSLNNIEQILVHRIGVTQFFKEYDHGTPVSVVFVVPTPKGHLPFRLPARTDKVKVKLYGQRREYSSAQEEQARRTAWKNVHDWIDAQMALIETDMVKLEEIFLPYMTDRTGKTIFERLEERGYELPSGQSVDAEEVNRHDR